MHRPFLLYAAFVALAAGLTGCGAETYDRRFRDNTVPLLEDLEELNQSLGPNWSERGINLRLPLGFEKTSPESGSSDETVSIQLPSSQSITLPGVLGVFSRNVGVVSDDGSALDLPAQIVVLSNREFLQSRGSEQGEEQRIDPEKFEEIVRDTLASAAAQKGKNKTLRAGGRAGSFQPTVRYNVYSFEITNNIGIPYQIAAHFHAAAANKTQVAILVIAPREMAPEAQLAARLPLCLRTLRINKPGEAGSASAGTGGASDAGAGGSVPQF